MKRSPREEAERERKRDDRGGLWTSVMRDDHFDGPPRFTAQLGLYLHVMVPRGLGMGQRDLSGRVVIGFGTGAAGVCDAGDTLCPYGKTGRGWDLKGRKMTAMLLYRERSLKSDRRNEGEVLV
jgi:hypothetical protein